MNLAFDFSRCVGKTNWATKALGEPEKLAEPCNDCRRREPGHPSRQVYMEPAADKLGMCINRIAPA